MAHECPECGCICYCNGDIDDILLNIPRDQDRCVHYKQCELDYEEEDYEGEDYDPRTLDEM